MAAAVGAADTVVGVEARGLALGALLALRLGAGFVMARKKGKLPPPVVAEAYGTEYSQDVLEMSGSIPLVGRVVIVDDLVATGGSLLAAVRLCRKLGGNVTLCFCPLRVEPLWETAKARFAEANVEIRTLC